MRDEVQSASIQSDGTLKQWLVEVPLLSFLYTSGNRLHFKSPTGRKYARRGNKGTRFASCFNAKR